MLLTIILSSVVNAHGFVFYGIPYAVTRNDRSRWKPSGTFRNISECWRGTLNAHERKKPCWQLFPEGQYEGSEDCLYLDIVTPKVTYNRPFPVVVLIEAETLNGGRRKDLLPSASLAKEKNVVFITVNFRLNVFGFLSVAEISRNSNPPVSGNYGLSDIITALEWIALNVHHFGGDPKSVTLLGHLAGGTLVTSLTASFKTKAQNTRLFHRAWITGAAGVFVNHTRHQSEAINKIIRDDTKCQSIRCLNEQTAEMLLEAVPDHWIRFYYGLPPEDIDKDKRSWLIQDGDILTDSPTSLWEDENIRNDIPLVFGEPEESDYIFK